MGRGSSKVGGGGGGGSNMSSKDSAVVKNQDALLSFKFLKKNVKDGNGEIISINDAYKRARGTRDFYEGHLKNMGTFDDFYNSQTPSSILFMTGKKTWDKQTARSVYNSTKARDKAIINMSKTALKGIAAEEKRRSKKK